MIVTIIIYGYHNDKIIKIIRIQRKKIFKSLNIQYIQTLTCISKHYYNTCLSKQYLSKQYLSKQYLSKHVGVYNLGLDVLKYVKT